MFLTKDNIEKLAYYFFFFWKCNNYIFLIYSRPCAYILVEGAMAITRSWEDEAARQKDEKNEKIVFNNRKPLKELLNKLVGRSIYNLKS